MRIEKTMCRLLAAVLCAGIWVFSGALYAGIEDGPRHADHPEWMDPGIVDLESDLETVRAEGRTGVMLMFSTEGCTYCAEFVRASLGDPVLQKRLRDNFATIGLEIFDDAEMTDPGGEDLPIKRFAERHKAGMAPTLLFFGPEGKLLFRAIGYQAPKRFGRILDYLIGGHNDRISFRDYLVANPEPVEPEDAGYVKLRDDQMFERPPYALSRRDFAAERPLLVIFEKSGCSPCADFHDDVLALPEVREILAHFQIVRLDASDDRTPLIAPDGRATTPARWFEAEAFTRLPALLYADEAGKTVLKVDAVVERQRMLNASGLVHEKAYKKGWSYQRFARTKAIERNNAQ